MNGFVSFDAYMVVSQCCRFSVVQTNIFLYKKICKTEVPLESLY